MPPQLQTLIQALGAFSPDHSRQAYGKKRGNIVVAMFIVYQAFSDPVKPKKRRVQAEKRITVKKCTLFL